jgi:hypothetical protein
MISSTGLFRVLFLFLNITISVAENENVQRRKLKSVKKRGASPAPVLPDVGIIDQCVAAYGEIPGTVVSQHQMVTTGTAKEMDTHCCKLCAKNPSCDFWVRSAQNGPNQVWITQVDPLFSSVTFLKVHDFKN